MRIILIYCTIFLSFSSYSQESVDTLEIDSLDLKVNNLNVLRNPDRLTTMYKTYDDYVNGTGTQLGVFKDYEKQYTQSPLTLIYCSFSDSAVKYTIQHTIAEECWGFGIGNELFRMQDNFPHHVYDNGKIVYYESGLAKLNSIYGNGAWTYSLNSLAQFSLDLKSKIVGANKAGNFDGKDRPDLKELCRCIEDGVEMVNSTKMTYKSSTVRGNAWVNANRDCMKFNKISE